ncbi:MAG: hypothetical protein S0880_18500 [Actinomycetota bacterium]|nr:hypothetical protein [Actinomycetota bacterium]
MMRYHLRMHGLSWRAHLVDNWRLTGLALWAAVLTFGHGLTPRVSGRRASELHHELWDRGRTASLRDLAHRLDSGLYPGIDAALRDLDEHCGLYDERPRLAPFRTEIERHYATAPSPRPG